VLSEGLGARHGHRYGQSTAASQPRLNSEKQKTATRKQSDRWFRDTCRWEVNDCIHTLRASELHDLGIRISSEIKDGLAVPTAESGDTRED